MNTLIKLYWESTRVVRFITMLVALLGSLGIYIRSHTPTGDVHLLLSVSPWWLWTGLLLGVAVSRWWCLWCSKDCHGACGHTSVAICTSVVSMYVWWMLITSAYVSQDFGLALMMLVCVACEAWLGARALAERISK